jgi:hypothetical protein
LGGAVIAQGIHLINPKFAGDEVAKPVGHGVRHSKSQSFAYLHPTFDGLTPRHEIAETTTLELI